MQCCRRVQNTQCCRIYSWYFFLLHVVPQYFINKFVSCYYNHITSKNLAGTLGFFFSVLSVSNWFNNFLRICKIKKKTTLFVVTLDSELLWKRAYISLASYFFFFSLPSSGLRFLNNSYLLNEDFFDLLVTEEQINHSILSLQSIACLK